MKKTLVVLTVVSIFFSQFTFSYAIDHNQTLSFTAVDDLFNQQGVEIIVYDTVEDYIEAVSNDTNLSESDKQTMILEAKQEAKTRGYEERYMGMRFDVKVTEDYHCYPYFYIKWKFFEGSTSPSEMLEVKNANIDRVYNGVSRQFVGTLYYNLETGKRLYWDLNGDFYNNGTTSFSGGIKIAVNEECTMNFNIAYASDYYAGVCKQVIYTF